MHFVETNPLIFSKLKEERPKKRHGYWFPYWCKFFAWIITLGIISMSITLLLMYGLTFGLLKCYLWIATVLISIFIGVSFVQPANVFLVSFIMSTILKAPPMLWFKKLSVNHLDNPYNDKSAFKAYKKRLDNTPYYIPIPRYKLEGRAENIKYHMEQRKLFVDVMVFVLFVIILSYVVMLHKSWSDYHSTEVAKHLTVYGSYTNTIPFTEVTTYRQFVEYLNETLLPALYGGSDIQLSYATFLNFGSPGSRRKARHANKKKKQGKKEEEPPSEPRKEYTTPSWDEKDLSLVRELFAKVNNGSQSGILNIYERSWTMDLSVKLIGKPRMRQLRVKNNTCSGIAQIKPRESLCFAEYSAGNEEYGDFYLWWMKHRDEVLTQKEQQPWLYESAWKTESIFLVGKYSSYPAGGYILELAKNLDDSRVIIDFMDAFQWIDARTRLVVIEFTLYSANVNLFNVVYLLAERSASGYFITSYQIFTAKFMFLAKELELVSIVMLVAFCLFILLFFYREAVRVQRTSFSTYMCLGNPTLDLLIIFLGAISVIFMFERSHYVGRLLNKLDESQNNDFVSFGYAAVWDCISTYMNAILVCLAAIKLFRLLRFRVMFLQMQETLLGAWKYFVALFVFMLVVLMAFTFFFHIALLPFDYDFSTLARTMSTLIGRAFYLDPTFDESMLSNTPWFIAPLFYFFFIVFMAFFIWSSFVAILCFTLSKVKATRIADKYNALSYMKHMLTASNKTDILRLKGGSPGYEDDPVLRLRGGGQVCARFVFGHWKEDPSWQNHPAEVVIMKRRMPTFTKAKVYDFSNGIEIRDLYSVEAMKRLTRAELEEKESRKAVDREIAMKALVARKLNPSSAGLPQKFYIEKVLQMRTIVENCATQRMLENYKRNHIRLKVIEEDAADYSSNVAALNKKISALRTAVDKRYKEERKKKARERRETATSGDVESGKIPVDLLGNWDVPKEAGEGDPNIKKPKERKEKEKKIPSEKGDIKDKAEKEPPKAKPKNTEEGAKGKEGEVKPKEKRKDDGTPKKRESTTGKPREKKSGEEKPKREEPAGKTREGKTPKEEPEKDKPKKEVTEKEREKEKGVPKQKAGGNKPREQNPKEGRNQPREEKTAEGSQRKKPDKPTGEGKKEGEGERKKNERESRK